MLSKTYTQSANGIWSRDDGKAVGYADVGDAEDRMLRLIEKADDISVASDELQKQITDWPTECHLSPLRGNIFTPFDFSRFKSFLEIGSGCGVMTRAVAEKYPDLQVVALEGSEKRAMITRARCRDLENVTVCRDSFVSFEPEERFDCITLIGVLEYSPSFYSDDNPFLTVLKKVRQWLKPEGVLIIAIENQLGLKYFSGCTEDHSGRPFTGVSNAYKPGTFRTTGKEKLTEILGDTGFVNNEFFYPFPDYKLTRLLLREESFGNEKLKKSHLPAQFPSRDYTGNKERFFDEAQAWKELGDNGLIGDMANSFLIFSGNGNFSINTITEPWLAHLFSCSRKKHFLTNTVIIENQSDLIVKKNLLFPKLLEKDDSEISISHHIGLEKYLPGTPYSLSFANQVLRKECFHQLIHYFRPWVDYLKKQVKTSTGEVDSKEGLLPGSLLDCLPSNFIVGEDKTMRIFDQEWEYGKQLELGFLLFRGIYRELSVHQYFLERTDLFSGRYNTYFDITSELFREFGFDLTENSLEKYVRQEVDIQTHLVVYNFNSEQIRDYLLLFFHQPREEKMSFYRFIRAGGTEYLAHLIRENKEQKKQLEAANRELDEMKSCFSWKFGRLATYFPRLLKNRERR